MRTSIALLLDSRNLIGVQAAASRRAWPTLRWLHDGNFAHAHGPTIITLVLGGVIVSAWRRRVLAPQAHGRPDSQLPEITYWLMGSLAAVTYHQIALGAPFIIAGVVIIWHCAGSSISLSLSG